MNASSTKIIKLNLVATRKSANRDTLIRGSVFATKIYEIQPGGASDTGPPGPARATKKFRTGFQSIPRHCSASSETFTLQRNLTPLDCP